MLFDYVLVLIIELLQPQVYVCLQMNLLSPLYIRRRKLSMQYSLKLFSSSVVNHALYTGIPYNFWP